ncbi:MULTISPECIES: sensor histidine kinase [Cytobacillus]|uniref:histidine kinase n=1 Tax=Cytobacillus stercorigallinarum TaxID=2762240 RepID=A0ABR8QQI9_9BACI|nr:sensor histidine kinase [Cytobacillus stercorigallinarum]MBD7937707.1 sensor histidine kinase [Cytobacillus stercorigallinarum]
MKLYWIWFLFNTVVWSFAILYFAGGASEITWRLLGLSVFFILFFLMPLVKEKPVVSTIIIAINALASVITLFPQQGEGFNPFLLLILSLLIAEAFYQLSTRLASMVVVVSVVGMISIILNTELSVSVISFILTYFACLIAALILFKQTKNAKDDFFLRYDALLSEYRRLKRGIASEEESARQEERTLIGHEIHDSVGHKLTALLMQIEVLRITANEKDKKQIQSLKTLASESLEETRNAVKVLKTNEVGGLQGILRLIRKLETESFIRIHFSVKHGAFTVPLTGEQSFVIFRSVQEALTNIMKHSNAREAEVSFEAPGGSVFRFEISNPVINNYRYKEGFGLISMRERLEKIGGKLEVHKTEEQFIVRGFIKITDQEGNDDTDTIG